MGLTWLAVERTAGNSCRLLPERRHVDKQWSCVWPVRVVSYLCLIVVVGVVLQRGLLVDILRLGLLLCLHLRLRVVHWLRVHIVSLWYLLLRLDRGQIADPARAVHHCCRGSGRSSVWMLVVRDLSSVTRVMWRVVWTKETVTSSAYISCYYTCFIRDERDIQMYSPTSLYSSTSSS